MDWSLRLRKRSFAEFGITLDVTPTQIKRAYVKLLVSKTLPPSGIADGMALEAMAYAATRDPPWSPSVPGRLFRNRK